MLRICGEVENLIVGKDIPLTEQIFESAHLEYGFVEPAVYLTLDGDEHIFLAEINYGPIK